MTNSVEICGEQLLWNMTAVEREYVIEEEKVQVIVFFPSSRPLA